MTLAGPDTLARMAAGLTAGARALLDSARTDDEYLGVRIGLFAEPDASLLNELER